MKQYGLIGKTLGHSFSKSYFENKFIKEQIQNAFYSNFPLESIEEFKSLIKKTTFRGLNVTIPYKSSIIPFLDELSEEAKSIGAVNTIHFKNNRLIIDGGHNISAALSIANWVKEQDSEVNIICGMLKDKDHLDFMRCFEGLISSATLIDIPNQESGIKKEDLMKKLSNLKINFKTADSIEQSIKSYSSFNNTIVLFVGSLYLIGEILNLN